MTTKHTSAFVYDLLAAPSSISRCLRITARVRPQIVLLDIGLPGLNGYEVARKLRGNGDKAHVIAVTGYGAEETLKCAGFDAYLLKPIDIDHLDDLIAGLKI